MDFKKLNIEEIIESIELNPKIGHEQRGDLRGIYVYHFSLESRTYILSYRLNKDRIEVISLGERDKYFKK
jgi:hypothetical protein